MNERGQVAGFSFIDSIPTVRGSRLSHPFLSDNGQMVDLGTLGGVLVMPDGSTAGVRSRDSRAWRETRRAMRFFGTRAG